MTIRKFCLVLLVVFTFQVCDQGQSLTAPVPSFGSADIQRRLTDCQPIAGVGVDKKVGQDILAEYLRDNNKFSLSQDIEANHYMEELLRRILAATDLGKLSAGDFSLLFGNFRDPLKRRPEADAFGGGAIIIEERYFLYASSEAALVHIIAHEVGHEVLRHKACYNQLLDSSDIAPLVHYQESIKRCAMNDMPCRQVFAALGVLEQEAKAIQEPQADAWALYAVMHMGYAPKDLLSSINKYFPERLPQIKYWSLMLAESMRKDLRPSLAAGKSEEFERIRKRFQKKYSRIK